MLNFCDFIQDYVFSTNHHLKRLFTHFEMLIVLHASHCVNGHYFLFCLFWQSDRLLWSQC